MQLDNDFNRRSNFQKHKWFSIKFIGICIGLNILHFFAIAETTKMIIGGYWLKLNLIIVFYLMQISLSMIPFQFACLSVDCRIDLLNDTLQYYYRKSYISDPQNTSFVISTIPNNAEYFLSLKRIMQLYNKLFDAVDLINSTYSFSVFVIFILSS
jgi:hypothetical protein